MNYNFTEKLQRIYFPYRRNYDAHEKLLHIHSKRVGVHLAEDPLNEYLIWGASYPIYKSHYMFKHLREHHIGVKNDDKYE